MNYNFSNSMSGIIGEALGKIGVGCFLAAFIGLFFVLVFAIFFSLIWNWVMPDIFGVPEITYLQAIGILLLTRMIFPNININNSK